MNSSIYEQIGGAPMVEKLIEAFYDRVIADPDLASMFPKNLVFVKQHQREFITELLGGPPLHTQAYGGHVDPIKRHYKFDITPTRLKGWLNAMDAAMDEVGISPAIKDQVFPQFIQMGRSLVNKNE